MFMIVHTLLGSLIGVELQSVTLIIILAVASHFILDWIPHWDGGYDRNKFHKSGKFKAKKSKIVLIAIDATITLITLFILYFKFSNKFLLVGAIAAVSPDLLSIGYYTKLKERKTFMGYLKFHSKIQKEVNWKKGMLIQTVVLIALAQILI